jgi:hypothetical protein
MFTLRALAAVPLVPLVLLVSVSTASAIVRRHDVPDSEYVVQASDYPAVVDLFINSPGDCLATLIAPEWLVTAAHCAEDSTTSDEIRVGGSVYGVADIDIHSGWNQDTDDIALLRLDAAVTDVAPIPWTTASDEVGQIVWFVGRGDTSTGDVGGGSVDGKTRAATNTVVSADVYWLSFVFNAPDDPEVTALEGISGDGDSGGPALLETTAGLRVVGLSSFQDEGSHTLGTYGVEEFYTRVSSYADWLETRTDSAPPIESAPTGASDTGCTTAPGIERRTSPTWMLLGLCLVPWRYRRYRSSRCRSLRHGTTAH